MKSLTKAIKQELDIDWDALDGKTVRIVPSGDLPFEATHTLSYNGVGPKKFSSSWVELGSSSFLYQVLFEAWYDDNDDLEIIMDGGVPLLDNTDSETIDPYSIPLGSIVLLDSPEGGDLLAYRAYNLFNCFAGETGGVFFASRGSVSLSDTCDPSSAYKIVSYITPEDLIQTLTAEPSCEDGAEATNNTVHIVSPDSFEAMGKRISGLIAHSFGGNIKENLPTEALGETTKALKNTVKLSLNLDPDVIGKNLNDSRIEELSKLDWGKK